MFQCQINTLSQIFCFEWTSGVGYFWCKFLVVSVHYKKRNENWEDDTPLAVKMQCPRVPCEKPQPAFVVAFLPGIWEIALQFNLFLLKKGLST